MPAPIVVFDLDGTLVDTAPDLANTLNLILTDEGAPPIPFDEARLLIGGGARAMLERGLRACNLPLKIEELDQLFDRFIAHYAAHIADYSRPFPGVESALNRLAQEGFLLAVCTNKLEWLSRKLLDALDLTRHFAAICGQDTFGVKKPDPLVWSRTIEKARANQDRSIMVGDSATDIQLARAAGVPVIMVDFGYHGGLISTLRPDRIVSCFDALPEAVREALADWEAGAATKPASR